MTKTRRHPELPVVLLRQLHTNPLAKRGGGLAQINRHIKHGTPHHPHQFALGLLNLVMQASQHALGRPGMVVLHKGHVQASGRPEGLFIETLKEKTARVTEHTGFDDEHIGNGSRNYLHGGNQKSGLKR